MILSDATLTTGSTASAALVAVDLSYNTYSHVETRAASYQHRANAMADMAMEYGMAGLFVTAEICAEFADELTMLARVAAMIDPAPIADLTSVYGTGI